MKPLITLFFLRLHSSVVCCLFLSYLLLTSQTGHAQSWVWARGNAAGSGYSWASAVGMRNGSTVVAGHFTGTLNLGTVQLTNANGGRTLFVARFNSAGVCTQAIQADGDSMLPTDLAIDASNNVVLTGTFSNTATLGTFSLNSPAGSGRRIFVARLSAAGTWTQALQLDGTGDNESTGIALDNAGTATVVGHFTSPTLSVGSITLTNADASGNTPDIFVARLATTGTWTQAERIGGTAPEYARDVAVDQFGTATVVGSYESSRVAFGSFSLSNTSTALRSEIFVARLSAAGRWTRALSAGSAGTDRATAVALDPQGGMVVGGIYQYSVGFGSLPAVYNTNTATEDVFVARLDTLGTWTQVQRMVGVNEEAITGLAVDSANNVLVGGYTRSRQLTIGNTRFNNYDQTNNSSDVFVACLSPAGTWSYALQAGGPWGDTPLGLAADGRGNCTLVGWFDSPGMTFGTYSLPNANPNQLITNLLFVGRVAAPATVTTAAAPAAAHFFLAPNPAHDIATLTLPAESAARTVQVLDALGREVRRQQLPARAAATTIDVAGLPAGLYIVRYGAAASRLVVE